MDPVNAVVIRYPLQRKFVMVSDTNMLRQAAAAEIFCQFKARTQVPGVSRDLREGLEYVPYCRSQSAARSPDRPHTPQAVGFFSLGESRDCCGSKEELACIQMFKTSVMPPPPTYSLCPCVVGHENVANDVRQSAYFQRLPDLPVSCRELDGDPQTMPIIFEDVFLAALTPQVTPPPPPPPAGACGKSLSVEEFVRLEENSKSTVTTGTAGPSTSTTVDYVSVEVKPSDHRDMRELSSGARIPAPATPVVPVGSSKRQRGVLEEDRELGSNEPASPSAEPEATTPLAVAANGPAVAAAAAVAALTMPGKPYPLPFLRSITRPASHARRRQQLLSRRRGRTSTGSSLVDPDVTLLGYRRVIDEFAGLATPASTSTPPPPSMRSSQDASCFPLANGAVDGALRRHGSTLSLASLPAIERDLGMAPTRFAYFKRRLHHTKSLPSLTAPPTSANEADAGPVTALGSLRHRLRLPADETAALSIPWCPRCGLPDWSSSSQRDRLGGGGHLLSRVASLAVSMPSLPSANSLDFEDVDSELSPQSDPGAQKRRLFRPSLNRLKMLKTSAPSWLTRLTSPSKIVRIGSCSNLAAAGQDSCQCGTRSGVARPPRPMLYSRDFLNVTEPVVNVAQSCRVEMTDFRQHRAKTQVLKQDVVEMEEDLADWMLVDPEDHLSPLERRLNVRFNPLVVI
ncbi:unnamed protein product [Schistocephalus solidus]|uniref:Uncharacterized protein n=1 Tax=Schistocephalus solidus TaxID=70667 RepID=A0A183TAN7_SCHSO|nr:unnamed protein product [Schistocephalus solidus]